MFNSRAQIRVEHQRQEAKMPLSKIIDIRKNLFAKVKASESLFTRQSIIFNELCKDYPEYRIPNWR